MSKSHLPDDLSRWPQNPFEILDVTPQVESGELRRKYAALIRRFKPEQYPEHFQRIRAAYELVRGIIEQRSGSPLDPFPALPIPSPPLPAPEVRQPPVIEKSPAPPSEPRVPSPSRDEIPEIERLKNSIWKIVMEGDVEEAYRQLNRLVKTHSDDQSLYIRLYWMHVLFPDLDEVNPPSRWLVSGILQCRETSQLYELLNRELCHFPEESLTDRFLQVILVAFQGTFGLNLLRLRWETARSLGNHVALIAADLERMVPRLELDSEEAAVRVQVLAFENLVWCSDPLAEARLKSIQDALDRITDIRLGEELQLDQLTQLVVLADSWKGAVAEMTSKKQDLGFPLNRDPLQLENLVPAFWISTGPHYHIALNRTIAAIADQPSRAFDALDFLVRIRSPIILHVARTLDLWVQYHAPSQTVEPMLDERTRIIQILHPQLERERKRIQFADFRTEEQKQADYHKLRLLILDLVADEYIWFGSIAHVLRSEYVPQPLSGRLAEGLENDFSLRIVCMILYLFWLSLREQTGPPDFSGFDYSDRFLVPEPDR